MRICAVVLIVLTLLSRPASGQASALDRQTDREQMEAIPARWEHAAYRNSTQRRVSWGQNTRLADTVPDSQCFAELRKTSGVA